MDQQINSCTTPEGVHLAYSVMGEGQAVVIPPGWVTHLEVEWEIPETRSFFESAAIGNTIIRYDKHGCGLSDRERTDFSLQKEVRDLGDVVQDEGRIYGNGVTIAARMEGLAEGGGICISGTVYDQVENKLAINCQYLGEKTVKNISRPVRGYKVDID